MTLVSIPKHAVAELVQRLMAERRTFGVKEKEPGFYAFDELRSPEELVLEYSRTILPPKKYFMPPWETLVRYRLGETVEVEPVFEGEPFAVVGVHSCDLHAILLLDRAFADVYEDEHYFARRRASFIVGVDCVPDEYCYCTSMGTCTVESGYDLFLNSVGEKWLVEVGSSAGAELVEKLPGACPASAEDIAAWKASVKERRRRVQRTIAADIHTLPLLLTHAQDHPAWREWGEKCLSCGQCILVCPTCLCFDVQDELKFATNEGERVRRWDGCMLQEFARIASGENFRPTPTERLRHRIHRKFHYLFLRYGKPFCTGCGRCTLTCPAEIDQVSLLNDLAVGTAKGVLS